MVFMGFQFTVVPVGTVVGKDPDGNDMIVTDESVVLKAPHGWASPKVFDMLKNLKDETGK